MNNDNAEMEKINKIRKDIYQIFSDGNLKEIEGLSVIATMLSEIVVDSPMKDHHIDDLLREIKNSTKERRESNELG